MNRDEFHFCMNCGTKLNPGDNFCVNCGVKVGELKRREIKPKKELFASYKSQINELKEEYDLKEKRAKDLIDKNSLELMKLIKKSFDPKNILNPGKIFEL